MADVKSPAGELNRCLGMAKLPALPQRHSPDRNRDAHPTASSVGAVHIHRWPVRSTPEPPHDFPSPTRCRALRRTASPAHPAGERDAARRLRSGDGWRARIGGSRIGGSRGGRGGDARHVRDDERRSGHAAGMRHDRRKHRLSPALDADELRIGRDLRQRRRPARGARLASRLHRKGRCRASRADELQLRPGVGARAPSATRLTSPGVVCPPSRLLH